MAVLSKIKLILDSTEIFTATCLQVTYYLDDRNGLESVIDSVFVDRNRFLFFGFFCLSNSFCMCYVMMLFSVLSAPTYTGPLHLELSSGIWWSL